MTARFLRSSALRVFGIFFAVLGLSVSAGAYHLEVDSPLVTRICVAQGTATFPGGLSNVYKNTVFRAEGHLIACLDESGQGTGLTGSFVIRGAGLASCAIQNFTLTQTIDWNNGNSSTLALQSQAGFGVYTGVVTSGELEGQLVNLNLVPVDPQQVTNCLLGTPIDQYNFDGTEEFLLVDTNS